MANFPSHLRGDTWYGFTLTATDVSVPETPVPVSFTGGRVVFQARRGARRDAPLALELTSDAGGGITISGDGLTATAASRIVDLPADTYHTEIQLTTSEGAIITLNQGTWVITEDVASGG